MFRISSGRTSKITPLGIVAVATLLLMLLFIPYASFASTWTARVSATNAPLTPMTLFKLHYNLTSPNAQSGGNFGFSVTANSEIVVVGAPYENSSGYLYAGNAYVFNATTGHLIYNLTSPKPQSLGGFGDSVAADTSFVVVGAPGENASGHFAAGHVYVFNATTGVLIHTLASPKAQYTGLFGYSVAAIGKIVVVGAPQETASGYSYAGNAYVFDAKTGHLIYDLTTPAPATYGHFGWSVATTAKIVVVGAMGETASGYSMAGHAYVFNAKNGHLVYTFTSPTPQTDGFFGSSVAADARFVVVGAYGENVSGYSYAGKAYTFNAVTGHLIYNLTSPSPQSGGSFGYSVAVSGNRIVVGAAFESSKGQTEAGNAYAFNAKNGHLVYTFTSPNAQFLGYFGYSVAATAKIVVVGAMGETASGYSMAGHAYVF